MKLIILLFVALIVQSCKNSKDEPRHYIPNFTENIKSFIGARKCFIKNEKVVTVSLDAKKDTLSVYFADKYPDNNQVPVNLDTTMLGYRIIFTGDRIQGFSNDTAKKELPADVIEINKSKQGPYFEDYTIWEFLYKGDKLVYESKPCMEK